MIDLRALLISSVVRLVRRAAFRLKGVADTNAPVCIVPGLSPKDEAGVRVHFCELAELASNPRANSAFLTVRNTRLLLSDLAALSLSGAEGALLEWQDPRRNEQDPVTMLPSERAEWEKLLEALRTSERESEILCRALSKPPVGMAAAACYGVDLSLGDAWMLATLLDRLHRIGLRLAGRSPAGEFRGYYSGESAPAGDLRMRFDFFHRDEGFPAVAHAGNCEFGRRDFEAIVSAGCMGVLDGWSSPWRMAVLNSCFALERAQEEFKSGLMVGAWMTTAYNHLSRCAFVDEGPSRTMANLREGLRSCFGVSLPIEDADLELILALLFQSHVERNPWWLLRRSNEAAWEFLQQNPLRRTLLLLPAGRSVIGDANFRPVCEIPRLPVLWSDHQLRDFSSWATPGNWKIGEVPVAAAAAQAV